MTGSKKEGCILKQPPFSFEELHTDSLNQGHSFPLKFIKMNSDPSALIFQISFLFQPLTFMLDQKGKLFPFHLNHLIYHLLIFQSRLRSVLCIASILYSAFRGYFKTFGNTMEVCLMMKMLFLLSL